MAAALDGASRAGTVLLAAAVFPEGPLWRDGKLLYVEYAGPGIKLWDGKHATVYWSGEHCGASGLIAYRHDHLLMACYEGGGIYFSASGVYDLKSPTSFTIPMA